jgi:FtsH-binding integral membrane protein
MSNAFEGAFAQGEATQAQRDYLLRVYGWMATGLGITGLVAYMVAAYVEEQMRQGRMPISSGLAIGLLVAQFVLVIALSAGARRLPAPIATLLFLGYSALTGVSMSFVLLVYTQESVSAAFVVTAGTFGAMSAYGALTKRDLTSIGSIAGMLLMGLVIASLVNIFLLSPGLSWALTYGGVVIFVGLTAYDTQTILRIGDSGGNAAILGALTLYLDFINLFYYLLRLFGQERRRSN